MRRGLKHKGGASPELTSAANVPVGQVKFLTAPCMSMNDLERTVNTDFGGYTRALASRQICKCAICGNAD